MRRILGAAVVVALATFGSVVPAGAVGETMSGHITDAAGHDLKGARVTRINLPCNPPACATASTFTDDFGNYSFVDAPVAAYIMTVDPPLTRPDLVSYWSGGVLGTFRFSPVGCTYTQIDRVPDGDTVWNVSIPAGVVFEGTVTSSGGAPVIGAPVRGTAATPSGAISGLTTYSDSEGHFRAGGVPGNAGCAGSGPSDVAVDVFAPLGSGLTNGRVPATGTLAIAGGQTVTGADVQLAGTVDPNRIYGSYSMYRNGVRLTLVPSFTGGALCPSPEVWNLTTLCSVNPFQSVVALADGTVLGGPYSAGTFTVRGVSYPSEQSPVWTTMTVAAGQTFHCNLPLDASITPVCVVGTGSVTKDLDGVSASAEDGAPNAGDGNGDGVPDSTQATVASTPDPTGGYTTIATTSADATIEGASVLDPTTLPNIPGSVVTSIGVPSFSVKLSNGATSAAIDLYVDDASGSLNRLWKYQNNTWTDLTTQLGATFTVLGDGRTKVHYTLTDGAPGDADNAANGTIVDPVAFGTTPPYTFTGFRAPIDASPVVNVAKAGSAIPVKWRLTDASGAPVSDPASFVAVRLRAGGCPSAPSTDTVETTVSTSGLKYLGNGEWQYNWKTVSTWRGCGTMVLALSDGTEHTALVTFR